MKTSTKRNRRAKVWEESKHRCFYCKLFMAKDDNPHNPLVFTLEHLKPQSVGGKSGIANLVGAHRACNQLRSSLPLESLPKNFCAICRKMLYYKKRNIKVKVSVYSDVTITLKVIGNGEHHG